MVFDFAQMRARSDYVGDRHGLMKKTLCKLAETQGLLFDPVYSGKSLDGLIGTVRKAAFSNMSNIVFLHAGDSPALFGYPDTFDLNGYTN